MQNLNKATDKELYQVRAKIRTLRDLCEFEGILTAERKVMFDQQEKELTTELAERGWGDIVPLAWDFY
jgi:hypothetical protein